MYYYLPAYYLLDYSRKSSTYAPLGLFPAPVKGTLKPTIYLFTLRSDGARGWGDHGLGHFMGNFFATCTTFSVSYPALRSRRRILVRKVPDPLPFTSFDWCILRLGFINCLSLPCVQWSKHGDGLAVIEGIWGRTTGMRRRHGDCFTKCTSATSLFWDVRR